jgi:hypothetical protein
MTGARTIGFAALEHAIHKLFAKERGWCGGACDPVLPGLLEGQGTAGDWQSDAPGVAHRISISDLPRDYATPSAFNSPRVVAPPKGAKPDVPKGFDVKLYASGFANPRYLLTAPNGDIFVTESSANVIHVLRDSDGDGHPEINQAFATGLKRPFGLAFYPPGPSPEFLYAANTDGIVRFYRDGDLKARSKPEPIADLSSGETYRWRPLDPRHCFQR